MDTRNVDSLFIAGKAVKRNGHLVGVDVDRLLRRAERARAKRSLRKAGPWRRRGESCARQRVRGSGTTCRHAVA
jgi:hypothetical protein